MPKVYFPDNFEVLSNDLEQLQEFSRQNVKSFAKDVFSYGIIPNTAVTPFEITKVVGSYAFNVGYGVAYDNEYKRIEITTSDTEQYNPLNTQEHPYKSSGCKNIPGPNIGETYYVWIEYFETENPSRIYIHPDEEDEFYIYKIDGYKISTTTSSTPPSLNAVFLGQIFCDAASNYVITYNQRIYASLRPDKIRMQVGKLLSSIPYTDGAYITLQDHINAVGTGVVTPVNPHGLTFFDLGELDVITHNLKQHTDGILGTLDDFKLTLGGGTSISISGLGASSFVVKNGKLYPKSGLNPPTQLDVILYPAVTTTYYFYLKIQEQTDVLPEAYTIEYDVSWPINIVYVPLYTIEIVVDGITLSVGQIKDYRIFNSLNKITVWGLTDQKPTGIPGLIGYNRETGQIEVYNADQDKWIIIG